MLLDPELANHDLEDAENLESSKWHALTRAVRRGLIIGPMALRAAASDQRQKRAWAPSDSDIGHA